MGTSGDLENARSDAGRRLADTAPDAARPFAFRPASHTTCPSTSPPDVVLEVIDTRAR